MEEIELEIAEELDPIPDDDGARRPRFEPALLESAVVQTSTVVADDDKQQQVTLVKGIEDGR